MYETPSHSLWQQPVATPPSLWHTGVATQGHSPKSSSNKCLRVLFGPRRPPAAPGGLSGSLGSSFVVNLLDGAPRPLAAGWPPVGVAWTCSSGSEDEPAAPTGDGPAAPAEDGPVVLSSRLS